MKSSVLSVCSLTVSLAGCAGTPGPTLAPVPEARFTYHTTQACVAPGSVPVTIAIVSPQFKDVPSAMLADQSETSQLLFHTFPTAMRSEFIAALSCRGFATKGPFSTYDEMVFPDRQGADLILSPEIELRYGLSDVTAHSAESGLLGVLGAVSNTAPSSYKVDGKVMVGGRFTMSLRESLTNTRMWTKTVELDPSTAPFTGEGVYSAASMQAGGPNGLRATAYNDPGARRVLTPMMEQYYTKILSTAEKYMDANDLQLVKRQSIAVRKNAQATISK